MSFGGLGPLAAQRPVGLVHSSFPEHCGQAPQGLACLGKHAYAADRPVEAVGDAKKNLPGLGVAFGDEGFVGVCDAFVAGFVALGDFSGELVYHQQVVVFI